MTAILILTALAAFAVLVVVAVVVMGHGGQLGRFEADHPPLDLPLERPVTGRDVARVRLPLALWGYHVRAVDELLDRVAADISERDTRIAQLRARLGEHPAAPEPDAGPRVRHPRPPGGSSPFPPQPQPSGAREGPGGAAEPPPVPAGAARPGDPGNERAVDQERHG